MKDFTRPDEAMALAVDAAIEMEASSGCVLAWQYLQVHAVPQYVAIRVLSQNGPRRALNSNDQNILLDRRSAKHAPIPEFATALDVAGFGAILQFPVSRTNHKLSETIDRAIEMMGVTVGSTLKRFYEYMPSKHLSSCGSSSTWHAGEALHCLALL